MRACACVGERIYTRPNCTKPSGGGAADSTHLRVPGSVVQPPACCLSGRLRAEKEKRKKPAGAGAGPSAGASSAEASQDDGGGVAAVLYEDAEGRRWGEAGRGGSGWQGL